MRPGASGRARRIALIDAPSNLGLRPPAPGTEPGVRRMAERLRELGIAARLGAVDGGRVVPPGYDATRDPDTGVRNARAIAEYSVALAGVVAEQIDAGRFPLVLGGDCSILLGSLLALRSRGRYGLAFVDGHEDLQTPATSRTGGAAGMDLALAVGIGPARLTTLGGAGPLVSPADVSLLGPRDNPDWYAADDAVRRARDLMQVLYLATLRELGVAAAGEAVARHFSRSGVDGVWIHLDVDVLDDAVMPAVDSRQADGVSFEELSALLGPILEAGRVAGMEVTIYDPDLDPGGGAGRALVEGLALLLA